MIIKPYLFALLVLLLCGCHHSSPAQMDDLDGGDTESTADGDTDSDTDSDTDTDTDSDTDSDADTDSSLCEAELEGACTPLVAGCAACPDGSMVSGVDGECNEDAWCCVPYQYIDTECNLAGGVCVFNMPLVCPPGFVEAWDLSCGGALSMSCCLASDSCV